MMNDWNRNNMVEFLAKSWRKVALIIVVIIAMASLAFVTMGASECGGESDKLAVTQASLAVVQVGTAWMNGKIQAEFCDPEPKGGWLAADCQRWETNWPKLTEIMTDLLPWAIDKMWNTTTPEERKVTKEDRREFARRIQMISTGR